MRIFFGVYGISSMNVPFKTSKCMGDYNMNLNVDLIMFSIEFHIILLILEWIIITHAILSLSIAYAFMYMDYFEKLCYGLNPILFYGMNLTKCWLWQYCDHTYVFGFWLIEHWDACTILCMNGLFLCMNIMSTKL